MSVTPTIPVPLPSAPNKLVGVLKRAWKGFVAAVTSSAAIKGEKNLAVTVVTGVLLSVGAGTETVNLIKELILSV